MAGIFIFLFLTLFSKVMKLGSRHAPAVESNGPRHSYLQQKSNSHPETLNTVKIQAYE